MSPNVLLNRVMFQVCVCFSTKHFLRTEMHLSVISQFHYDYGMIMACKSFHSSCESISFLYSAVLDTVICKQAD